MYSGFLSSWAMFYKLGERLGSWWACPFHFRVFSSGEEMNSWERVRQSGTLYLFVNYIYIYIYIYIYLFIYLFTLCFTGGSDGQELPGMQETWVRSLGWEDPLEEGMATNFSVLAWRIPWTEEPGGLQSMQVQRVRHDWETFIHFFIFRCTGPSLWYACSWL